MLERRSLLQKVITYFFALLLVVVCLFPFILELSISLKGFDEWGSPNLIPQEVTFEAYKSILGIDRDVTVPESVKGILSNPALSQEAKDKILATYQDTSDVFPFIQYMRNSLFFAGISSVLALIFSVFSAYALSRIEFPGREIIQRSVLFVYMIGGVLLMIPLYQIAAQIGLTSSNTGKIVAIVAIYILQTIPVAIFMLGNYFRTIPYTLEEAAFIDGAGQFKAIFTIILPLSLPMLVTVFIYCFIIGWNEYLFASIFLKESKELYTLPFGLNSLTQSVQSIWGTIMAASILTLLPVALIYSFIMGSVKSGLSEGGVKE